MVNSSEAVDVDVDEHEPRLVFATKTAGHQTKANTFPSVGYHGPSFRNTTASFPEPESEAPSRSVIPFSSFWFLD
jgi:hypothetical protein